LLRTVFCGFISPNEVAVIYIFIRKTLYIFLDFMGLNPFFFELTNRSSCSHSSYTLPFETRKDISRFAISPDGTQLIVVDSDGAALLINLPRRIVLAPFNFKEKVHAIKFSPNGKYFAVGRGKTVQLWRSPGLNKEFAPFILQRELPDHFDRVTCLDWSDDSRWLLSGSRDMTVQLRATKLPGGNSKGARPMTLAGHRDLIVNAMFGQPNTNIYTVSKDGALFIWQWQGGEESSEHADPFLDPTGKWKLLKRHYFSQNSRVHSAQLHRASNLLVVGFENGIFGLYDLAATIASDASELVSLQKLSVSSSKLNSVAINTTGEWLAFASARYGQLLVWEWQSERYVLKQAGHFDAMTCVAYSPEGQYIATGGQDSKLKVWNSSTGFCFVTFKEHSGPVTGAVFSSKAQSVISSSLDGTVRAFDLVRYRNFRTFTSPAPTQFSCVAIDPSAEVVAAGSSSDFSVYVWSMATGRLLDILEGHEGPVAGLQFSPVHPQLATGSWDRSVRIWELYTGAKVATETLEHQSDLTAVTYRPDGNQLCAATLDGNLQFWNPLDGTLVATIEGKKDINAGRSRYDVRTAKNNTQSKYFTSVCYSADGRCVLASGNSRYVCLYEVESQILLKKFQLSHNRSIEGVLDYLDTREAHLADLENYSDSDDDDDATDNGLDKVGTLPGVQKGIYSKRRNNQRIKSSGISFSPSGRQWALSSSIGLLIYSLDDQMLFDPYLLDIDITPDTTIAKLEKKDYLKALIMSLRLNESDLTRRVLTAIPATHIQIVAQQIHASYLGRLLTFLAQDMEQSQHVEFYLLWGLHLLTHHGQTIKEQSVALSSALRALQKNLLRFQSDLSQMYVHPVFNSSGI
jgi:periodic tryptophan protein 2